MTTILEKWVDQKIQVVTSDGRIFVGKLQGFDQNTNVALSECSERVFNKDAATEVLFLGLYVIRGDSIAIIGEIDEDIDNQLDLPSLRAAPLKPITHSSYP